MFGRKHIVTVYSRTGEHIEMRAKKCFSSKRAGFINRESGINLLTEAVKARLRNLCGHFRKDRKMF